MSGVRFGPCTAATHLQVAMFLGYLLSKNHGAGRWDKKIRAKTVPNLPRAAALAPLEILKKKFISKILRS